MQIKHLLLIYTELTYIKLLDSAFIFINWHATKVNLTNLLQIPSFS